MNERLHPLLATTYDQAHCTTYTAPAWQIKATAGLGKTREVIGAIAESDYWRSHEVHYFAPDHKQADEVEAYARHCGLRVQRIKGRSSSKHSAGYCARFTLAEKVVDLCLGVYQTLCERSRDDRCPQFDKCPYLEQWKDKTPAIRIFPHQYLFLHRPIKGDSPMYAPVLNVVDESIVQKVLNTHSTFAISRLSGKYLDAARDGIHNEKNFRRALVEHGVTRDDALGRAKALERSARSAVSPSMQDGAIAKQLGQWKENDRRALAAFYRGVASEIDLDRPFHGIEIIKDEKVRIDGEETTQDRVHVYYRRPVQIGTDAPLLLIDADADLALNTRIFQREIEEIEISVQRQAHVVQCSSTALSNKALIKPDKDGNPRYTKALAKVGDIILREAASAEHVLVVMPKKVEDALAKFGELDIGPDNGDRNWHSADVTHFGAIRGKNNWESYEVVIIVGRNEPRPAEVDRLACAMFAEDTKPLCRVGNNPFSRPYRGFRMRDGSHWGVRRSEHFDPRAQKLLEQIREGESLQAIDRIRLVHGDRPKRVIILSSLPLDITVDEVWTLDDLAETPGRLGPVRRLHKALARNGLLSLGARDLARAFPDLFPSPARAKDALRDARGHPMGFGENGGGNQINLFGMPPHFRRARYRRAGQRGRQSWAIYDPARHRDPREALSKLLQEHIVEFEDLPAAVRMCRPLS